MCSNLNSCYCDRGWTSYDCSQRADERAHPEVYGPIPSLFTTPEAEVQTAAVADWKNKTIRSSFVGKNVVEFNESGLTFVLCLFVAPPEEETLALNL